MNVGKIAWTEHVCIGPLESVTSAENKLIHEKYVVVKSDGNYVGLLTIADVLAKPHILIADCIQPKPHVDYDTSLETVLEKMEKTRMLFLPVFRSGAFYGVVSYQGITQALREQREMLRNRELSHLGKIEQFNSLRCLAGGVAHDFNNLLSAIIGFIDIVDSDAELSPKNREYLANASKAATSLRELASQLLCFSKQGALIKEETDIVAFIEENARFMSRGYPISIEVDVSSEVCKLDINRVQFARVVNNLVVNAAQAVGTTGGRLKISGHKSTLTKKMGLPLCGECVCISFSDNGPGIDKDHLPYIFDPYFTTKTSGTGMGLAIVFSIITDHGGFVTVDSDKSRGTTFNIYLPNSDANDTTKC